MFLLQSRRKVYHILLNPKDLGSYFFTDRLERFYVYMYVCMYAGVSVCNHSTDRIFYLVVTEFGIQVGLVKIQVNPLGVTPRELHKKKQTNYIKIRLTFQSQV